MTLFILLLLPVFFASPLYSDVTTDASLAVPKRVEMARFRIQFKGWIVERAGNFLDITPSDWEGPDSSFFPLHNSGYTNLARAEQTLQKIEAFPQTKAISVCRINHKILEDSKCEQGTVAGKKVSSIPKTKPFELPDTEKDYLYKEHELESFAIDVWREGETLLAQFSGDPREKISRSSSTFSLPTHRTLGIRNHSPKLNGFELAGKNLDLFYQFVRSYRDYLRKLQEGDTSARFVVCARPDKRVTERTYDGYKSVRTYKMYPATYCQADPNG